jgi:hypothetical protein
LAVKHIRVLLPSSNWIDHDVEEVGDAVVAGLPGNKNFPNPPVDPATLQTGVTDFHTAIGATVQGGIHATADKNKKKHDLVAMLRKLGLYVQANCNEDVAILTSSGFQAASTVRTLGPLPKPVITTVANGHTGQLLITVQKIVKAKSYALEMATVTNGAIGEFKQIGLFTTSRNMQANGLTPGATYAFRVKAVGGTTGTSDYSDPVSHMSL